MWIKVWEFLTFILWSATTWKKNYGSLCISYETESPTQSAPNFLQGRFAPKNIDVSDPKSCIDVSQLSGRYECEFNMELEITVGYIKPECVCPSYLFYPDIYDHPVCMNGMHRITCQDCKKYSLKQRGPCLNNGTFRCKDRQLAKDIKCSCPEGYSGYYCQTIKRVCEPQRKCCRSYKIGDSSIDTNCSRNYTQSCPEYSISDETTSGKSCVLCLSSFYTLSVSAVVMYFIHGLS